MFKRFELLSVLCLALFGIAIILGPAARNDGFKDRVAQGAREPSNVQVAQVTEKVNLSVMDPRPVAKALEELENRYGWVITYEDPLYDSSETSDVTAQVRKDFGRNGAPRVLIPKGGPLSITYEVTSDTKLPLDRDAVIQKVLDANQPVGRAARFRLEHGKDGEMLHVVPTVTKTSSGELLPYISVLDAVISISEGDRTPLQTLETICDAVSQATQTHVVLGTAPLNLFMLQRDKEEVLNRKARDVLVQTLQRTKKRANLAWQLFYDPGMKMYALNIHTVALRNAPLDE